MYFVYFVCLWCILHPKNSSLLSFLLPFTQFLLCLIISISILLCQFYLYILLYFLLYHFSTPFICLHILESSQSHGQVVTVEYIWTIVEFVCILPLYFLLLYFSTPYTCLHILESSPSFRIIPISKESRYGWVYLNYYRISVYITSYRMQTGIIGQFLLKKYKLILYFNLLAPELFF